MKKLVRLLVLVTLCGYFLNGRTHEGARKKNPGVCRDKFLWLLKRVHTAMGYLIQRLSGTK